MLALTPVAAAFESDKQLPRYFVTTKNRVNYGLVNLYPKPGVFHMMKSLTTVSLLCLFAVSSLQAEDGWVKLFNGKDLTGWKVSENPGAVSTASGLIVVYGPRAHAFYVGEDGKANFKNFEFKAKVLTTKGSNSGIYIHTKYQESGWPNQGYECQVNNTQRDPKKTGGLYNVQDNFKAPVKDGEWFDYEIMVKGKRIVVKINGKVVSDYTEPADLNRPERQLSSGTFALQAHDPGSLVLYKDLMVKRLDD